MKVILDFGKVKVKKDIFEVFQKAFVFAYPSKGFDSLEDSLNSLETESKIYNPKNPPTVVTKHFDALEKVLPSEAKIVKELLRNI